jgi:hypothetical protein
LKYLFGKVGIENGILPVKRPLAKLPDQYSTVEALLEAMPVVAKDR